MEADSLNTDVIITDSGSLCINAIIQCHDSFLLHAEINRFDSLSSLAVIPGGGSLLQLVIIVFVDSLCPNAVINRL